METDHAKASGAIDLERNDHQFLMNNTVQSFTWDNLTVTVKDRRTKKPRNLIEGCSGTAHHGITLQQTVWHRIKY